MANNFTSTVTELNASTGAVIQTITLAAGSDPSGISSDGTHVWVTNPGNSTLTELSAATGSIIQTKTIDIPAFPADPSGVWSDGTHVWVADGFNNRPDETS